MRGVNERPIPSTILHIHDPQTDEPHKLVLVVYNFTSLCSLFRRIIMTELEQKLFDVIDLLKGQIEALDGIESTLKDSLESCATCSTCGVGGAKYSFSDSFSFYCEDCFAQKENELNKKNKPRVSQYDCHDCKVTCDKSVEGGGTSFRISSGLYLCDSCKTKRDDSNDPDLFPCSGCGLHGCSYSKPHNLYLCGDCFVKREEL